MKTLREMGYAAPDRIVTAVRGWQAGHVRADQRLEPLLLDAGERRLVGGVALRAADMGMGRMNARREETDGRKRLGFGRPRGS